MILPVGIGDLVSIFGAVPMDSRCSTCTKSTQDVGRKLHPQLFCALRDVLTNPSDTIFIACFLQSLLSDSECVPNYFQFHRVCTSSVLILVVTHTRCADPGTRSPAVTDPKLPANSSLLSFPWILLPASPTATWYDFELFAVH